MPKGQSEYLAREVVQIMVGVLGVHRIADVPADVIDDVVKHVKEYLATTPRLSRAVQGD